MLQEGVADTVGLIAYHGVQADGVDAVEDAFFNVGVVLFQAANEDLDLLALGPAASIVTDGAVFCKAAGALDKFQVIIPPPS